MYWLMYAWLRVKSLGTEVLGIDTYFFNLVVLIEFVKVLILKLYFF